MPKNNVQKFLFGYRFTLFSPEQLKLAALKEERQADADQGSSEEGPDPSRGKSLRYDVAAFEKTLSNSYTYRLYLYYKKYESPEALVDYLEKHPAIVGVMLKHLLQDHDVDKRNVYIVALSKSKTLNLDEIARNANIPENLRQMLPQVEPHQRYGNSFDGG